MNSALRALALLAAGSPARVGLLTPGGAAPAWAQEAPDHHAYAPVDPGPGEEDDRLTQAVAAYQSGRYDQAMALLSLILSENATPLPTRIQALVYLSEVFLALGNEESARDSFRAALGLDPGLRLDPFEHPPDVCAFFEIVRTSMSVAPLEPPLPPPPSMPPSRRISAWIPLGIPQQRQGRAGAASLLATGQGLSCGLSLGLNLWLSVDRRYSASPLDQVGNVHSLETLRARRNVQWATTATCQVLYGLGVADAALWQRRHPEGGSAKDRPPPAPRLSYSGRF